MGMKKNTKTDEKRGTDSNLTRRDFLRTAAGAAAALTLPGLASCSSARARTWPAFRPEHPLVIKNCRIIDVKKGEVMKENAVIINRDRISSLSINPADAENTNTVDAGGRWLIPGLIDAHCHTTLSPVFTFNILDSLKHLEEQRNHFPLSVQSGVTTLRDVGSFPDLLAKYMDEVKSGELPGPRVYHCNSILNIFGGHPDLPQSDVSMFAGPAKLFTGSMTSDFTDDNELRDALIKNAEKASFIKLTMDRRSVHCRDRDIKMYSDTHLNKIFSFADKKGLPVSAHCQTEFGVLRSLKYPMNSVEHMASDKLLSDSDIENMAKKNLAVVPTMMVGQSYLMVEAYDEIPDEYRDDFIENEVTIRNDYFKNEAYQHCVKELHESTLETLKAYKKYGCANLWKEKIFLVDPLLFFGMIKYGTQNLKRMKDAGVLIGCGIDAGVPLCYFGGIYRELEFYSRAGFTNHEILKCATINNARILKAESDIGSIEPGKYADLVLLDRNPLTDVTAYRKPVLVLRDGKPMHSNGDIAL
jgi:imidazolonepropionase-like amidohydrolase